ncbi:MAG: 50S ribosomal protein L11 methyltransferase [Rickettsiales bacterium]|jgi:ribosomal protein L11 methyltransferase|nr:50S ribosomal protein L11 methyltransferase [Rickettsiales bacterium]
MLSVETEGLHPSTNSCLEALAWLSERANCVNTLEIGCGNGILSAVAVSIWAGHVTAVDISEKALADSRENLEAQGLLGGVTLLRSDGFSHPSITERAPYDLIICNLLAELQVRFAKDSINNLKTDGYLVLSGILNWKLEEVLLTYKGLGLLPCYRLSAAPWETVLFRHATVT